MGQIARIDKLPPEVRDYLDLCLQNPALSHEQVSKETNDYLIDKLGLKPVITRRIVQRHDANQRKIKEEFKRNQQATCELVKHVGNVDLGDMSKGIAAIVSHLAIKSIGEKSDKTLEIKDVKELTQISKSITETAAINFDLGVKKEAYEKSRRGEKIIPHDELDVIYEEQLQQQAELQAKIAGRKKRESDNDYLEQDE